MSRAKRVIKYWCAILCGISFVVLFFSLEETNFDRERGSGMSSPISSANNSEDPSWITQSAAAEKTNDENDTKDPSTKTITPIAIPQRTKSYPQKLKVFGRMSPKDPSRLPKMAFEPLSLFSFPVIVYAGFSYGSNLIWFNVLNGTASLILSGKPYGFSSSMVGLSYLSPLLGAVLG